MYCKQHTRTLTHLAKYKRVVQKKITIFFHVIPLQRAKCLYQRQTQRSLETIVKVKTVTAMLECRRGT